MSASKNRSFLTPIDTSYDHEKNKVIINFLENGFYKNHYIETLGMFEMPSSKLKRLAERAKSIQQPTLYGQFLNEQHYMETLDLVLDSTAETAHRGIFYLKKILPQLPNKHRVLDIGPGNGNLTQFIGRKFKEITIVDNCNIALNRIDKKLFKINHFPLLTKVHSDILTAKLPSNYYNLILVSHVLYYIDTARWLEAANICYNSLAPGGIMVIVLSGAKLGKARLMREFSGKTIDIDSYVDQCANFFQSPVEAFASDEKFYAFDLNTILHIAGLLLHDVHAYATKEELANYLLQYHKKNDNLFEISTQQEFIVIKKQ